MSLVTATMNASLADVLHHLATEFDASMPEPSSLSYATYDDQPPIVSMHFRPEGAACVETWVAKYGSRHGQPNRIPHADGAEWMSTDTTTVLGLAVHLYGFDPREDAPAEPPAVPGVDFLPPRDECTDIGCHNFGGLPSVCGTGPLFDDVSADAPAVPGLDFLPASAHDFRQVREFEPNTFRGRCSCGFETLPCATAQQADDETYTHYLQVTRADAAELTAKTLTEPKARLFSDRRGALWQERPDGRLTPVYVGGQIDRTIHYAYETVKRTDGPLVEVQPDAEAVPAGHAAGDHGNCCACVCPDGAL